MQCNAMQFNAMRYSTVQLNTIQLYTIQYNITKQYNSIQHNDTIQHNSMLYGTTLYQMTRCTTIAHNITTFRWRPYMGSSEKGVEVTWLHVKKTRIIARNHCAHYARICFKIIHLAMSASRSNRYRGHSSCTRSSDFRAEGLESQSLGPSFIGPEMGKQKWVS